MLRNLEFPLPCNGLVASTSVKGSNEEDDLVGHQFGDNTRIKNDIVRVDISYPRRDKDTQEDDAKDNLISYEY